MNFKFEGKKNNSNKTEAELRAMDYYTCLGVSRNATKDEIARAFKSLSKIYHPDVGGDQGAFQAIQEAYYGLGGGDGIGQDSRAKYDRENPEVRYSNQKRSNTEPNNQGNNTGFQRTKEDVEDYIQRTKDHQENVRKQAEAEFDSKIKYAPPQHKNKPQEKESEESQMIRAASNGPSFLASFAKQKNIPLDKILQSSEIQKIILTQSIKEIMSDVSYYTQHIDRWVQETGLDRKTIDKNPKIREAVLQACIEKSKDGSYFLQGYIDELEKSGILTRQEIVNDQKLINSVKSHSVEKAAEAAFIYNDFAEAWEKQGFDRKLLDTNPELLKKLSELKAKEEKGGKFLYDTFLESWKKIGINL